MTQPIDYAPVDSADVVRKKFRRRILMLVVASVVVMVIGVGWELSLRQTTWLIGDSMPETAVSISSAGGWITWYGPPRQTSLAMNWTNGMKIYESSTIGVNYYRFDDLNYPKWQIAIRYRTLFILAMIPWTITLIRMIRMWKRKRAVAQLTSDL